MTLRVSIKSSDFETKSGVSKKGQAYSIREQTGYLHAGEEVRRIRISLGRDQPVYAVGMYVVADESFTTGAFDAIVIERLILKPVPVAAAQPQRQAS
jgi:hypothetical protein